MSLRRWDAKRDANEKAIVDALEAVGAHVLRLSISGAPDLLVSYRNGPRRDLALLEVKTTKGKVNKRQRQFEAEGWTVFIVRSVDDALRVVGIL